jgi:protein-S-isoprenylcysteine O-methyltransferase Ste14
MTTDWRWRVFRHRDKIAAAAFLITLALVVRNGQTLGLQGRAEDWVDLLGVALVAGGHGLRLWALRYIGPRSRTLFRLVGPHLATTGPYALVRNPLYVANWIIALGLFTVAQVKVMIVVGPALTALLYYIVALVEERGLRQEYGEEYEEYCRRTPRFIPRRLLPPPADAATVLPLRQILLRTKEYQAFLVSGVYIALFEWVERLSNIPG